MKKSTIILLICVLTLIVALCISIAYGKNHKKIIGSSTTKIGKPIVEIEANEEVNLNKKNSYYNVTIKNYNDNDEVSMVSFDFTVNVETTDNSSLPEYYWIDSEGTNIGKNLTGNLSHTTKETKTYKICFINSENTELTKNIKFIANVIQKE